MGTGGSIEGQRETLAAVIVPVPDLGKAATMGLLISVLLQPRGPAAPPPGVEGCRTSCTWRPCGRGEGAGSGGGGQILPRLKGTESP